MGKKTTIGYAYVVADIFHLGHLQHLLNCKALCDKLFVGVLSDQATMEKKPRPIVSLAERLQIIRALKCVDVAVAQNTYSPLENVREIKPDILFESASHKEKPANELMKAIGGKVISMPYYPDQSSTAIKKKVLIEWREMKTKFN